MIDPNKPMRLSDGTPVTVNQKVSKSEGTVAITADGGKRDNWIYNLDGTHHYGLKKETLENYVPFDPSKPVETRGGFKARIVATDAKGSKPIVALVEDGFGNESTALRLADGRMFPNRDSLHDLVNVEPTKTTYVSLGNAYSGDAHNALARAKREDPYGHGVLKVVQQGNKLISAELVTQ